MRYKINLGEKMNKEFMKKILIYVAVALFSAMTGNVLPIGSNGDIDLSKLIESSVDENGNVTESVIGQALRPTIESVVNKSLEPVIDDVSSIKDDLSDVKYEVGSLKDYNVKQVTNNAIAAYDKVKTIEDLNASPLKKVSITDGLMLDSCYDILYAIDMERTKMFYDYLIRDAP